MGNCFNVEQGQHGLPCPGRMSTLLREDDFPGPAYHIQGQDIGVTPCESLCLFATCCVSGINYLIGLCSGEACVSVSLGLIVLLPL